MTPSDTQDFSLLWEWRFDALIPDDPDSGFINDLFKKRLTNRCPVSRASFDKGGQFRDPGGKLRFTAVRACDYQVFFLDGNGFEFAVADRRPEDPRILRIGRLLAGSTYLNYHGVKLIRPGKKYDPIFLHLEFPHITDNRQLLAHTP